MKLYSYVVRFDKGFAPNPERGYCTLACCKPIIRKHANAGDWIVGTGSVENVGRDKLIYVMKVREKILFEKYAKDRRFRGRKDNIYYKKGRKWKQKPNPYHNKSDMKNDLKGGFVLISNHFIYFGKRAPKIQDKFKVIVKKGPGHKCNLDKEVVESFIKWVERRYPKGKIGKSSDEGIPRNNKRGGSECKPCS